MKLFILCAVALVALVANVKADYPKESDEEHNKIITECRKKFKMTDEEYTKLRLAEIPEPEENMKCLANCFMEKAGVLKDGEIQLDVATKLISKKAGEEKAKKIIETCRGESGSTNCDTAYKLHKCFVQNEGY